jgi:AraC-like DNA-binding protein
MPQPTVSKHLRVLREAGFVESTVDAQRRLYRLKPEPLQEVDAWLAPFRRFWSAHLETHRSVSRAVEESNRRLLRARDAMDLSYAQPLDVAALARIACVSEAHFIRTFRATFGETPHRYLQRRRVERSMFLLRESDRSVTDICLDVGYTSLGTFSRRFREIVGQSPRAYRRSSAPVPGAVPSCFTMAWARPSSFGEAGRPSGTVKSGP